MTSAVVRGIARKLRAIIRLDTFWVLETDLTQPIPDVTPRLEVEFRPAVLEDVPFFVDQEAHTLSQEKKDRALRRMSSGDVCTVGIHDNQFVSYMWTALRDKPIVGGKSVGFGRGWCYGYGSYVVRRLAGNRLHQAHLAYTRSYFKRLGLVKRFSIINAGNVISLHASEKLGSRKFARFYQVVLLRRWRLVWKLSDITPYVSMPAVGAVPAREPSENQVTGRVGNS